jgi:hypothetical protein
MKAKYYTRLVGGLLAGGAAIAAASYATYAAITWYRYGRVKHQMSGQESNALLDLYLQEYEIAERHHVRVAAPAEITFAAACQMNLSQSAVIRALFKAREMTLSCAGSIFRCEFSARCETSGQQEETLQQKKFLAEMKELGWGLLAEIPGREIVLGTVTQPWVAKTVFRAVPPEEFAAFHEPGYVKIAFTVRADPVGASESVARTETRVTTTDPFARAKFRRYWSLVSPGAILIRRILLRDLKTEAERRTYATCAAASSFREGHVTTAP